MSSKAQVVAAIQAARDVAVGLPTAADPPPPPPPPTNVIKVWRLPLNMSDITCLVRQSVRGRYVRQQTPVIFTTTAISENFERFDVEPSGGAPKALNYVKYTLEIGGVERAVATAPWVNASTGTLKGAFAGEPDELYLSELYGYDAGGTKKLLMRCGIYLDRNGQCKNSLYTWRQSGSFTWEHGNPSNDVVLMTKAYAKAVPLPLPARKSFVAFSTAIAKTKVARRSLQMGAFANDADHHDPSVMRNGITVCDNLQGYGAGPLFEKHSRHSILMGPRNVARLPAVLNMKTRRSGQTLACGNGYIAQLDSTGAAQLMAGHCHREAIHYTEPATSVLDPRYIRRGKWEPSIPVEDQIFWEPWGGDWVPRSLLIDMNAAPINGEQPHLSYTTADGRFVNGPLWLQTDRTGCVWAVQFDGHDLTAEPSIYRFLPAGTLMDGWGLVTYGNSLYIGERVGNKISEWNLDTRQKIGDAISDPLAAAVGFIGAGSDRRFYFNPGKTVADARSFKLCYPEGLDKFIDPAGDLWLYFTSSATQWFSRFNTRTKVFEQGIAKPWVGNWGRGGTGDFFTTLAVSQIKDGFGPPGTMFFSTFVNTNNGKSGAYLPDGSYWDFFNMWGGGSNYAITQCVGGNRLTTVDIDGWIDQFFFAEAGDKLPTAQWLPGLNDWIASGLSAIHGPNAISKGSTPYVFGESGHADRDVYARDFLGLA